MFLGVLTSANADAVPAAKIATPTMPVVTIPSVVSGFLSHDGRFMGAL